MPKAYPSFLLTRLTAAALCIMDFKFQPPKKSQSAHGPLHACLHTSAARSHNLYELQCWTLAGLSSFLNLGYKQCEVFGLLFPTHQCCLGFQMEGKESRSGFLTEAFTNCLILQLDSTKCICLSHLSLLSSEYKSLKWSSMYQKPYE